MLDAMLAYAETRARRDAAASPTSSTSASAAATSGRRWWCRRSTPTRTPGMRCTSSRNVDGHDLAPVLRRLDAAAHAVHRRQQDLHDAGDDGQRAGRARTGSTPRAAPTSRATSPPPPPTSRPRPRSASPPPSASGTGSAGAIRCGSAIGLPIAIAIGADNFRALLAGAHAMDQHFAHAPLAQNLPVLLGLLDVWYRNFHGFTSRSVAPYHQGLSRLPAYLQQLEMESNGKRVDLRRRAAALRHQPGGLGRAGHQRPARLLPDAAPGHRRDPGRVHRGQDSPAHDLADQHTQAAGQLPGAEPGADAGQDGSRGAAPRRRRPPRRRSTAPCWRGTAPSPATGPARPWCSTQLTPRSLGALIALYEHRVFTSGALWGINSFDQWGVELGKALCNDLLPRLASGDTAGLDASTAGLLRRLRP